MSLARKLAIRIAALVVGLALLGGASLWGLGGLTYYFEATSDKYEQLRRVYEIGHDVAMARALSRMTPPDTAAIAQHLDHAIQQTASRADDPDGPSDEDDRQFHKIGGMLREAREQLRQPRDVDPQLTSLNPILAQVAGAAAEMKAQIVAHREAAYSHLLTTIGVLAGLTLVMIAAAIYIGVRQYRSVVIPLRRIEDAVRRIAEGHFDVRVPVTGDREFAQLAERFNRTTEQLEQLYRDLEEQVNSKSNQLVRSQRLAGVGYLAAGVAHEINNPLGIIAGYAESALRKIEANNGSGEGLEKAAAALRIICDEAFRCKEITEKLLTMARPGDGSRAPVSLSQLAHRVTQLVTALPQFKGRTIRFHEIGTGDESIASAGEGEITQVLLNLVCNALEAVEPESGAVTVEVQRRGEWVVVSVMDNGRGMSPEILSRVFEPFFTDKPQRDQRGMGLGLAVAHAIVTQHGGRLNAQSDGPGRGSVFTLELPAIEAGVHA